MVAVIAEKADGTPLFIEEITRSLLETGVVRDTGSGYEIDRSVYAMAVPSTLQDSLMARRCCARRN
jgi:predicted ATPase